MDIEVPGEVRRKIVEDKLAYYRNTVFDAGLDVKVAQLIGNSQQLGVATERMKKILTVVQFLEAELAALEEESDEPAGESGV